MVDTEADFQKRLALLGRKHATMAKGYVMRMRPDGLVVVHLTRPNARRVFPLRGLIFLAVGFCVFKALILASLGDATYDARIDKLAQGTIIEQSGAWLMHVDPVTDLVAGALKSIAR